MTWPGNGPDNPWRSLDGGAEIGRSFASAVCLALACSAVSSAGNAQSVQAVFGDARHCFEGIIVPEDEDKDWESAPVLHLEAAGRDYNLLRLYEENPGCNRHVRIQWVDNHEEIEAEALRYELNRKGGYYSRAFAYGVRSIQCATVWPIDWELQTIQTDRPGDTSSHPSVTNMIPHPKWYDPTEDLSFGALDWCAYFMYEFEVHDWGNYSSCRPSDVGRCGPRSTRR